MTFLAWIAAVLVWLATAAVGSAHAQATPVEAVEGARQRNAVDSRPRQGDFVSNSRDEEARALFEAGKVAYEDGRFVDALGYFEHSYELSKRTALQYNLGLAYDRLRRDREALAAFEAYLEAPDPARAPEVQNRVKALREHLAEVDAAEQQRKAQGAPITPVVPVQRTDGQAERMRKRRIWMGVAASVLAVSAGVIISVVATRDDGDARPKPNSGVTIEALSWR